MDIFEQLGFEDLLRVSKVFPENLDLIGTVFRNTLKNHAFAIGCDSISETMYIRFGKFRHGYKDGNTLGYLLEFLQEFGHYIIKFDFWNNSIQDKEIRKLLKQHISDYVAKFVNEIYFYMDGETIDDLIVPFPNATSVKLQYGEMNAAILREMFPAVRNLELLGLITGGLSHFPHLESLKTPYEWGVDEFQKTFQHNPQLKKLSISNCKNFEIMKTIHEMQSNLDTLEISILQMDENEVVSFQFANIKVLKCHVYVSISRDQLKWEFGNLEEIEFNHNYFVDYWVDVMVENKKLRKVTALNALRRNNLERIANELPNLEEFFMYYDFNDVQSSEGVTFFLQNAKKLKNAKFWSVKRGLFDEVLQQVNNEWEIIRKKFGDKELFEFIRKCFFPKIN